MKIVINSCYGGFGLSNDAVMEYAKRKGMKLFSEESNFGTNHYYTVPVEEFKKIEAQCIKSKNYDKSNKLYFCERDIERNDPILVKVVEDMGSEKASGAYAELRVVEIPDDVQWEIDEYDGWESVDEVHRSWN